RFDELTHRFGASVWDYSSSPTSARRENFYNSQHLNAEGAMIFSNDLAERLAADPVLGRPAVRSYSKGKSSGRLGPIPVARCDRQPATHSRLPLLRQTPNQTLEPTAAPGLDVTDGQTRDDARTSRQVELGQRASASSVLLELHRDELRRLALC